MFDLNRLIHLESRKTIFVKHSLTVYTVCMTHRLCDTVLCKQKNEELTKKIFFFCKFTNQRTFTILKIKNNSSLHRQTL